VEDTSERQLQAGTPTLLRWFTVQI